MLMKHLKLFAATCAIAGIAFVGCNKNQPDVVTGGLTGNEITFGTSIPTKTVTEVNATSLQAGFKVCCFENLSTPQMLFNDAVNYYEANAIKDGSAACWKTTTTYFWRDATMNFYAAYPAAVVIDPETDGSNATFTLTGLDESVTTDYVAAFSKDTEKPAAASFAYPAAGAVTLAFKHVLSQLSVLVEPEDKDANLDYEVTSLTVSNGNGDATYTFDPGTWGANTNATDVEYCRAAIKSATTCSPEGAHVINGNITGGVDVNFGPAANSEWNLYFPKEITVTAAYRVVQHDTQTVLRDFTVSTKSKAFTLTKGKKTTLTVVLPSGVKPIYFTVTVEDWVAEPGSITLE